jgi:DNA-binding NarL/FixJ family response regulator
MIPARRIVVVDDHPLLAAGLAGELERSGVEAELLDPLVGPEQLIEALTDRCPDCVVLDLRLPFAGGGLSLIAPLVGGGLRVMVLTGQPEPYLWARSLALGAAAIVSKSEPLADIVEAILRVAGGESVPRSEPSAGRAGRRDPFAELSPREQQVLAGLMKGHAATALAEQHYVSVATIRAQIRSVLAKLGVSSQLEAVALAHRHGWCADGAQP